MTIRPCQFNRLAVAALPATTALTPGVWPTRALAPIALCRAPPFIYTKSALDNEMVVTRSRIAARIAPGTAPPSLPGPA